jgi:hypothetical protein
MLHDHRPIMELLARRYAELKERILWSLVPDNNRDVKAAMTFLREMRVSFARFPGSDYEWLLVGGEKIGYIGIQHSLHGVLKVSFTTILREHENPQVNRLVKTSMWLT